MISVLHFFKPLDDLYSNGEYLLRYQFVDYICTNMAVKLDNVVMFEDAHSIMIKWFI